MSELSPDEQEEVDKDIPSIAHQIVTAILAGDMEDARALVPAPLVSLRTYLGVDLKLSPEEQRRANLLAMRGTQLAAMLGQYIEILAKELRDRGVDVKIESPLDLP